MKVSRHLAYNMAQILRKSIPETVGIRPDGPDMSFITELEDGTGIEIFDNPGYRVSGEETDAVLAEGQRLYVTEQKARSRVYDETD